MLPAPSSVLVPTASFPMDPSIASSILPFPQPPNPNPNPNPNPDLSTTISLLKDLSLLAESTIKSIFNLFSSSSSSNPDFVRCPFDSRHRIPPESLFRHSLRCPSSSGAPLLDLAFLDSLHYPTSFKSEAQLRRENRFVRSLPDSDADLCFSLESELEQSSLVSNFFYKDCPGVVTIPEPDALNRTFVLPAILSVECANFVDDRDGVLGAFKESEDKILPSEFWSLRCEVEAWSDFPVSYSYAVLRVGSSLDRVEECGLKKWVISNSPQFGILLDVAMRDHLFLLLKLCLKAIQKEALCSLKLFSSQNGELDVKSCSFECPRLVGSLMWLASQLSVLYGVENGRLFTIGMIRESLLQTGSRLMLFKLEKEKGRDDGLTQPKSTDNLETEKPSEDYCGGRVFVSQIAAAVAALHERSLLEERIKSLRFAQSLPKSQLVGEYLSASARACELREQRPNYRAVVEHDGLLWQRANNQDSGKAKTREELLAEERDYKRRRMSYRGKKVKRNPTEVLHDIIEEHMEEINRAGGIGCNAKAVADTDGLPLERHSQKDITANIHRSNRYDTSEAKDSVGPQTPLHAEDSTTSNICQDLHISDHWSMHSSLQNPQQKVKYGHSEYLEDHKKNKRGRDNYVSRSTQINRNYSHLHERYKKEQGGVEAHRTKYDWKSSGDSSGYGEYSSRSTLTSKSAHKKRIEGNGYTSGSGDNTRGRAYERFRSESVIQGGFEDRYDPSSSYDGHDATYDDVSVGSNFLRLEKHHGSADVKYLDEEQRHHNATKSQHRDHYKK